MFIDCMVFHTPSKMSKLIILRNTPKPTDAHPCYFRLLKQKPLYQYKKQKGHITRVDPVMSEMEELSSTSMYCPLSLVSLINHDYAPQQDIFLLKAVLRFGSENCQDKLNWQLPTQCLSSILWMLKQGLLKLILTFICIYLKLCKTLTGIF